MLIYIFFFNELDTSELSTIPSIFPPTTRFILPLPGVSQSLPHKNGEKKYCFLAKIRGSKVFLVKKKVCEYPDTSKYVGVYTVLGHPLAEHPFPLKSENLLTGKPLLQG